MSTPRVLFCVSLTALLLVSNTHAGPDKKDLLDYLAEKIAANPDSPTPYLRRAHTLAEMGLWDSAFTDLEQLDRIGDQATADLVRGDFYSRQQQWQKAETALNTVIAKQPDNIRAYLLRAEVHIANGNRAKALTDYTTLFSLQPEIESGFYRRAAHLTEELKGPGAALALLDRRMETTGPIPQLQKFAIDIARRNRQFGDAIARMNTLSPLLQGSPFWHREIAELYRAHGDPGSARHHLQVAQKLIEGRRQSRVIRRLKHDVLALGKTLDRD